MLLHRFARLSDDGRYRYTLAREWEYPSERRVLFVMLNPSTADANTDDPTIRRCMAFAGRIGCTTMSVVNLFALRATDPLALLDAEDRVGELTDTYILCEAERADRIVLAWGAHKAATPERVSQVLALLRGPTVRASLECLGKTKSGAPRHPLYLAKDTPLEVYDEK